MINRRQFVQILGFGNILVHSRAGRALVAPAGGTLDPTSIPKYASPLLIPPAMPRSGQLMEAGKLIDYYEIAVRQFRQQILAPGLPSTTVWSYGSVGAPASFNYPAYTIEARADQPVRVKWINDLKNPTGRFLSHILPVDQTLHWANPPGPRDQHGTSQQPYDGPVPIVTHLHGAHVRQESDGFPEAWYLPDATNIPGGFYKSGSYYDQFKASSPLGAQWAPGTAVFQYDNDQRATTLWYHDHTLGMTRANVYAGPAGFYLLRGGPGDAVIGTLPGPAPALGDPPGKKYYEIPLVIQDRSFNSDGSLFYPDNRAFFEGLKPSQLRIPFRPDPVPCGGISDISPIHNPEFFANTMVVNGRTWPYLEVEKRRYRFRFLNGCNSRFLILKFSDPSLSFWQIGADGGFLPAPVQLSQLLMGPAERADVIVDFTNLPQGAEVILLNIGPDEPFGGGVPGVDFPSADPSTTGQVMQFRVVAATSSDPSTPPNQLVLPAPTALGRVRNTRQVSLNEADSATVKVKATSGGISLDCDGVPYGPAQANLGTVNADGTGNPLMWAEAVTENPAKGATEIWEIHNFTEDAHPIHVHVVQFEVVNRQPFDGYPRSPESWESGRKDTLIAYPGEITRVKAYFDIPGLFVWHCHILEHEDNEMMRPYRIG